MLRQAVGVIEALVSGPVGVLLGWALSYFQARAAEKKAERERLLALMQQLVVAVLDLQSARRLFKARHVGRRARLQVGLHSAAELLALANRPGSQGLTWQTFAAGLSPVSRLVRDWDRASTDGAGEVVVAMSRVAAAGLPLGMAADPAVAAAAQALMDASLQDESQDRLDRLTRELRWAFYPEEAQTVAG